MACSTNEGQLPGPVSSESGKVEGRGEGGRGKGPIPSTEETPHPAAIFGKRGFVYWNNILQLEGLVLWKGLTNTCVFGSLAWTAPSFLLGTHWSPLPRDVLHPPPAKQSRGAM